MGPDWNGTVGPDWNGTVGPDWNGTVGPDWMGPHQDWDNSSRIRTGTHQDWDHCTGTGHILILSHGCTVVSCPVYRMNTV